MRIHALPTRRWQAAVLAGVLSTSLAGIAHAQSTQVTPMYPQTDASGMPRPSMRMVSQTPVPAPAPAPAIPVAAMTGAELRDAAVDAYIYAYPMVLMEMTRRASTNVQTPLAGRAPVNQFGHRTAYPDPRATDVAWPSTDALYSSLWYDVSREPLIIQVPASDKRYYLLSLHDMWSDMYAARGTRTSGNVAQTFAIVGPSWNGTLPPGVDVVRSPTSQGWMIGRVQTASPADYAAVNQFQSGLVAAPLSGWGRGYSTPAGQVNPAWSGQGTPAEQVAAMDAASYFTLFDELVRANPPHANDYPMLDRLRRIGFGRGQAFSFGALEPSVQQALAEAKPLAGRRIADAVHTLGRPVNGWTVVRSGIGTYGTDYTRRAAVAYAGLGASTPEEVLYPVTAIDDEGEPLNSDEDYVLHFDKGQLPPVDGYWTLILYDARQGFTQNPIGRYAVTSTDPLVYNKDGSLDIYIRRDPPSREKQANWLPAPQQGNFMLNMRLYAPRNTALDGLWGPPPVRED
ncbi:DUF1254 domain-containing protein [Bordetella genomosp. 13]|uniref:DUF1254 domain-containing protein n=1 Tax=Bordetella genomosp. 13 TaxID=463040 RepID=UPI0011A24045|nr:DUF1254 domain-containing protein [Bordetella genomosp. 13]